jgi:zinc transporter ZupT
VFVVAKSTLLVGSNYVGAALLPPRSYRACGYCVAMWIHAVYLIPRCLYMHHRRLLQGSEADVLTTPFAAPHSPPKTSNWVTEDRKLIMKRKLLKIKNTVAHLVEHIDEPTIDKFVLHEMYQHMNAMDRQIEKFHSIIESNASKWRRNSSLPDTQMGDKLPMNLILPVTVDCLVDGFLIGVSVAISPKAGYILAAANCFEMSFLGMAYASRLVKCTGTTALRRNLALYGPPLLMFLATGMGARLASAVRDIPVIFVAFVAFGVVALMFLVCNELLIEAKNAQGEEEKWWISICIFAGIYMVLIVNQLMPGA